MRLRPWVVATALAVVAGLGIWTLAETSTPPVPVTEHPIEDALASVVRINWDGKSVSTGFITGKRPIEGIPELHEYFMITAFHSLKNFDRKTIEDELIDVTAYAWLDPNELAKSVTREVQVHFIASISDLLVVSFDSELDLKTIKIADDKHLDDNMRIGDPVIAIGCDAGNLPLVREGILATKSYAGVIKRGSMMYSTYPKAYFNASFPVWKGASGGPVLTEDGQVVGMILSLDRSPHNKNVTISYGSMRFDANINGPRPICHIPIIIKIGAIKFWLDKFDATYVLEGEK